MKETTQPVAETPTADAQKGDVVVPAGDVKTADQTPTEPKTEAKYELKLPKDALLDNTDLERIVADAKARGLSPEDAQAILDRENSVLASYQEKQVKQTQGIVGGWQKAVMADPEIGGADFAKNAELAKRAVERFGSPELRKALDESGLGDHPELVRMCFRIGKAMANDTFVHGAGPASNDKTPADVLYGGGSK